MKKFYFQLYPSDDYYKWNDFRNIFFHQRDESLSNKKLHQHVSDSQL